MDKILSPSKPNTPAPAGTAPIRMTRAEYQAKYGQAPNVPTVSSAQPVRMTRAEYDAKYNQPKTYTNPYNAIFRAKPTDNPIQAGAKALGNIPSSTYELGKGLVTAVAKPRKTVAGIFGAIRGGGEALGRKILEQTPMKDKIPAPDQEEQSFNAIVQSFKDRYGSLDNAKKTATEDPMGFGADVLTILEGGAGLVGKGKELSSILSKTASPVTDVTKNISSKIKAPFKSSFDAPTAKKFASEGIEAPISAVTKSPFLKGAESLVSKSIAGKKVIDVVKNATETIKTRVSELVDKLKPEKVISDENLGKTIQEGLSNYEANFKQTSNKIYDEFTKQLSSPENKMGNPPAIVDKTQQIAREIVNQQSKSLYKGVDSKIMNMLEKVNGNKDILKFDNLKETRTMVGEELAKNPQSGPLKRLYGALTEDMNATVNKVDPELSAELKKVNDAYMAGKTKIESNIAQSIQTSNPERIAQNIIKRNSADTLKQVKEMIGEERFGELSKVFTRQTFEKSVTRGEFDIDKFKKNLAEYDQATLDEILTKPQQNELNQAITQFEKYKEMRGALKSGEKYAEGSQTAFLQSIKGTGTRVGAIGTALLTGNWGIATAILAETGGELMLTKLFTSEFGRKLLTEGLTPSNNKILQTMKLPQDKMAIISNAFNRTNTESSKE